MGPEAMDLADRNGNSKEPRRLLDGDISPIEHKCVNCLGGFIGKRSSAWPWARTPTLEIRAIEGIASWSQICKYLLQLWLGLGLSVSIRSFVRAVR